jgi:hypothetical protein
MALDLTKKKFFVQSPSHLLDPQPRGSSISPRLLYRDAQEKNIGLRISRIERDFLVSKPLGTTLVAAKATSINARGRQSPSAPSTP